MYVPFIQELETSWIALSTDLRVAEKWHTKGRAGKLVRGATSIMGTVPYVVDPFKGSRRLYGQLSLLPH